MNLKIKNFFLEQLQPKLIKWFISKFTNNANFWSWLLSVLSLREWNLIGKK